jgi:bacterioferritin
MGQVSRAEQKEKVIEVLNKARAHELHAIHQYMHQHYNLANWDYGTMAVNVKLIGIDEMRHAEMLADRIEELGGVPTAEPGAKTLAGQKVEVIFKFDANLEDETIASYNDYAMVCRENGDSLSMKLFETIMNEEQIHFNYFDNVDEHITNLDGTYLAQIAGSPSSTGLATQGFVARQGGGAP